MEAAVLEEIQRIFRAARFISDLGIELESVVQGLDRFATIGETVRRNQFGSHPWFSPEFEE